MNPHLAPLREVERALELERKAPANCALCARVFFLEISGSPQAMYLGKPICCPCYWSHFGAERRYQVLP